ncbi:hypothetical protein C8J57DRAFT_1731238 [Mycena rebaudengoi]|nr:hypothetical protein C8J57DRAFT_1731238 [Mycena rebaudengoi]
MDAKSNETFPAVLAQLPSELLGEVFSLCVPSSDIFDSWPKLTSREHLAQLAKPQLLALSQVCATWYRIVMGTPALWNTIEVDLNGWILPSTTKYLNSILESTLLRSGDIPLNIKFRATSQYCELRTLQLLATTSSRWLNANLDLSRQLSHMFSDVRGNVPQLARLQIHGDYLNELTIFADSPSLRSVTLRGSGAAQPPIISYSQLHTLCYDGSGTNSACLRGLFFLLRPTLRELRITCLDTSTPRLPLLLLPRRLDELTSFHITLQPTDDGRDETAEVTTEVLRELIRALTLPSLRQFTVSVGPPPAFVTNKFELALWDNAISFPQSAFVELAVRSGFDGHLSNMLVSHNTWSWSLTSAL